MSAVQQLYELQELDLARDKVQRRLKEIAGQLGETPALRTARANLQRLQAELARQHTRRQDLELETRSLEAKIASVEELLYSGRVTNPKELTDLQKDAAALRRQRSALDEKSLQVMAAIEENEAAIQEAQATLTTLETDWTARQRDLLQERADLEAHLAQLEHARAGHLPGLPAGDLACYESLRQSKNGLAIATVENDSCAVCGVELSEHTLALLLLDETLVFCNNCGRILVE